MSNTIEQIHSSPLSVISPQGLLRKEVQNLEDDNDSDKAFEILNNIDDHIVDTTLTAVI